MPWRCERRRRPWATERGTDPQWPTHVAGVLARDPERASRRAGAARLAPGQGRDRSGSGAATPRSARPRVRGRAVIVACGHRGSLLSLRPGGSAGTRRGLPRAGAPRAGRRARPLVEADDAAPVVDPGCAGVGRAGNVDPGERTARPVAQHEAADLVVVGAERWRGGCYADDLAAVVDVKGQGDKDAGGIDRADPPARCGRTRGSSHRRRSTGPPSRRAR
jgi:hypothetical protein